MRARAPGKIVISGAYAVLEGAPALVSAVDRYVIADSAKEATFVTPEVRAALGEQPAPGFDASALREQGQKLGLGSSAAILVASLAVRELVRDPGLTQSELAERVFPRALVAHAEAQGGGSGIDVAASVYGGVLVGLRVQGRLNVRATTLPEGIVVRVFALGRAASTAELVGRVQALRSRDPELYARCLSPQSEAAEQAVAAVERGDALGFIAALSAQVRALTALGDAAEAPIVTPEVVWLQEHARKLGAVALPSGAGGGDIALWVSHGTQAQPPLSTALKELPLGMGALGVHASLDLSGFR